MFSTSLNHTCTKIFKDLIYDSFDMFALEVSISSKGFVYNVNTVTLLSLCVKKFVYYSFLKIF